MQSKSQPALPRLGYGDAKDRLDLIVYLSVIEQFNKLAMPEKVTTAKKMLRTPVNLQHLLVCFIGMEAQREPHYISNFMLRTLNGP